MTADKLRELAAGIDGLSGWKIVDRQIEGRELFFIRRDVDLQRSKDVRHAALTVYRDFREGGNSYRGSVTASVYPTHTAGEVRALVEQSLKAAAYVHNEPYPLVKPGSPGTPVRESRFASRPLERWLGALAETIYAEERRAEAAINSSEIFLNHVHTRILNSLGLDVSYGGFSGYIELITEASGEAGEVELYREMRFSDFEPQLLATEVREQLLRCRDRAAAAPLPHLKRCLVLITGDPVPEFFRYYLTHSAAQSVYSGLSTARVGDSIQGNEQAADPLGMSLDPALPNSTLSAPWDGDGWPLHPVRIIEDGRLVRYWGPLRFCHYLQAPPTGAIGNLSVDPGSRPVEELRRGPLLEVVYFSDFVTESLTGDFGGEIRLAYYTDAGGRRRPVTGGSISGNIRELQAEMLLSRETQSRTGFRGPLSVLLPEVSVAGGAAPT
jgi:predicted Zn-dependent protease